MSGGPRGPARAPGAPLRIGVITTSYPRADGDPAGGFVGEHVRALRALGHEVDVIAAGPADDADRADATADPGVVRVPGTLFYRGGAPDLLERAPLAAALPAAAFTLRLAAAAAARARARAWDAVVAHWLAPSALVTLPRPLQPLRRPPLLAIAHGGDVHTLRRLRLLAPALRALRRRGAHLAFVSEDLREIACGAAPALAPWLDEALVQPMGLDLARFAALGRAPAAPPTILVAARLVPIKGVDVALAALAHLRTPARLVIAGEGPERAALAALAARAPGGAVLLGQVDTRRRDQLLREASVVAVPSRVTPAGRTEGTPAIALEALAAGVPVVASAVGGLCALPAARLVPPDDPPALARELDRVLTEPEPPAPETLRRSVANLDWRAVAERLLQPLFDR